MNNELICNSCINNDICKYVPVMKNVMEVFDSKIDSALRQHLSSRDPISLELRCKKFEDKVKHFAKEKSNWWDKAPVKPET